jgi:hypothetical protein
VLDAYDVRVNNPPWLFFVQAGTIQAVHTLDEKNQNRQGTGKTGVP